MNEELKRAAIHEGCKELPMTGDWTELTLKMSHQCFFTVEGHEAQAAGRSLWRIKAAA